MNDLVIGILGSLIATLITMFFGLILHRDFFLPYLFCETLYRNKSLRVSMAAFLRIRKGNQYLLIRNQQRPESFGPLGGVIKFFPSARLGDRFEFQNRTRQPNLGNDLRGFLPGRQFMKFMKWFHSKEDRELESVTRELVEELSEIGLPILAATIQALPLTFVRHVHEGVQRVPKENYYQFRYIEVYELNAQDENGRSLIQELFSAAEHNDNLLAVNDSEINRRRAYTGELIGVHAAYLIGSKRSGPEPVPFYE